jgi:hypothetical protein
MASPFLLELDLTVSLFHQEFPPTERSFLPADSTQLELMESRLRKEKHLMELRSLHQHTDPLDPMESLCLQELDPMENLFLLATHPTENPYLRKPSIQLIRMAKYFPRA